MSEPNEQQSQPHVAAPAGGAKPLRPFSAPEPAKQDEPSAGQPVAPQGQIVLYRCKTPTNFLCPCGAAARRLKKLDLEFRTERVAFRKGDRPEIVELTRQRRVPVLVEDDEVISDSRRILQYLEWRHGEDG